VFRSSEWSVPFTFFKQNIIAIPHLSHPCHMSYISHHSWFDHPNIIWWNMQVRKLLIMNSSPASCHFLPLRSKFSPDHPVLNHTQWAHPLAWEETKLHTCGMVDPCVVNGEDGFQIWSVATNILNKQ
jgi:hypothetical protein